MSLELRILERNYDRENKEITYTVEIGRESFEVKHTKKGIGFIRTTYNSDLDDYLETLEEEFDVYGLVDLMNSYFCIQISLLKLDDILVDFKEV